MKTVKKCPKCGHRGHKSHSCMAVVERKKIPGYGNQLWDVLCACGVKKSDLGYVSI